MNSINPTSLNQQGKLFIKQTLDVFQFRFSVEIIRVVQIKRKYIYRFIDKVSFTMHVGIE